MIGEREIWRCANEIVKQHGDEAPLHAAQQADAMLDKGDLDGKAVWLRILKAAEELLRVKPEAGESAH